MPWREYPRPWVVNTWLVVIALGSLVSVGLLVALLVITQRLGS